MEIESLLLSTVNTGKHAPDTTACAPARPALARRYWRDRDSCPAELQIFRGRRLVPVLCGKAVRPVHTEQTKVTPEILAECWAAVGVALIVPRSVSRRLGDAFQRKAASLFSKQA